MPAMVDSAPTAAPADRFVEGNGPDARRGRAQRVLSHWSAAASRPGRGRTARNPDGGLEPWRAPAGATGGLLSYFTRHRTAANLLLVVLIVLGLAAAPQHARAVLSRRGDRRPFRCRSWDGAGAEDVSIPPSCRCSNRASCRRRGGELAPPAARAAPPSARFRAGLGHGRAADEVQAAVDRSPTCPRTPRTPRSAAALARPGDRRGHHRAGGRRPAGPLRRRNRDAPLRRRGHAHHDARHRRAPHHGRGAVDSPDPHDITMAEIAAAIAAEADADPRRRRGRANTRVRTGGQARPDEIAKSSCAPTRRRVDADGRRRRHVRSRASTASAPISSAMTRRCRSGSTARTGATPSKSSRRSRTSPPRWSGPCPRASRIDLIRTRAEAITGRLDILLDNGLMGLALVVGCCSCSQRAHRDLGGRRHPGGDDWPPSH